MERDCLIAHGATALMQERLLYPPPPASHREEGGRPRKSDAYRMLVCARCGGALCHDGRSCARCRTAEGARALIVPYNFKLLLQEMLACGIQWRFEVRG